MKPAVTATLALLLSAAAAACHRIPDPALTPSSGTDSFGPGALSRYTLYNTPDAWSVSSGGLVADGTARQSVAIRNGLAFADGWVETVTRQAGDGGLVLRMQDGADYYLLAIRDDSRYFYANIQMYRFIDGVETELTDQLDISWPAGTRKTVRFEASGTTLRAYVDGTLVQEATDGSFSSGRAGLRHHSARGPSLTSTYELFRWHH